MSTDASAPVLTDHDIPSLLGLNPRETSWSLWQRLHRDLPPTIQPDLLADRLLEPARDWLLEQGAFPCPVRKPHEALVQHDLSLAVTPDLVIEKAEQFGQGFGVAVIALLNPADWARHWRGNRPQPVIPPDVAARVQTLLLVSRAKWALVVPFVGFRRPKESIHVAPDRELQSQISAAISAFLRSLADGNPPPPDGRAPRSVLAALASHCPSPSVEAAELSEPETRHLLDELNAAQESRDRIIALHHQLQEETHAYRANLDALAQAVLPHGAVALDGAELSMTVETELPPVTQRLLLRLQAPDGNNILLSDRPMPPPLAPAPAGLVSDTAAAA